MHAVWFCIPPIGSNRHARLVTVATGGSNTEHNRVTRMAAPALTLATSPACPLGQTDAS